MSMKTLTSSSSGGECRNPSFGLATKAKDCKVVGQERDPGVISHALGSEKSVRE
jgi:hypothetical protein